VTGTSTVGRERRSRGEGKSWRIGEWSRVALRPLLLVVEGKGSKSTVGVKETAEQRTANGVRLDERHDEGRFSASLLRELKSAGSDESIASPFRSI
jgi:hypothetical protein